MYMYICMGDGVFVFVMVCGGGRFRHMGRERRNERRLCVGGHHHAMPKPPTQGQKGASMPTHIEPEGVEGEAPVRADGVLEEALPVQVRVVAQALFIYCG